uniref:Uncharacterized protein n=1 Tax=Glycine max TaxID=3847 RepID=A0A0R0E3K7_SOYBN
MPCHCHIFVWRDSCTEKLQYFHIKELKEARILKTKHDFLLNLFIGKFSCNSAHQHIYEGQNAFEALSKAQVKEKPTNYIFEITVSIF